MASTLSMSGLTARVSGMRSGVHASRASRVVASARPAVVRPRSIVPGMTSSRVAMSVRADASKPVGSTVAKLATVAQPAVEEKSVPAKSKLVVPALALAAAAVAMAPRRARVRRRRRCRRHDQPGRYRLDSHLDRYVNTTVRCRNPLRQFGLNPSPRARLIRPFTEGD